jgi:hypothetical protein
MEASRAYRGMVQNEFVSKSALWIGQLQREAMPLSLELLKQHKITSVVSRSFVVPSISGSYSTPPPKSQTRETA